MGNDIPPIKKLTTNLCDCEVPKFFIRNQKVSGKLFSYPVIQLSTLRGTPNARTEATDLKTGTHLYFVKGPFPKAGNTYNMAGNAEVGFSDEQGQAP